MGPERVAENQRAEAQKIAQARKQAEHTSASPTGSIGVLAYRQIVSQNKLNTPVIGQGLVHAYDSWSSSPPVASSVAQVGYPGQALTTLPVDGRTRTCAHCGATSTLITLRGAAGKSGVITSDLSSTNGLAIFQLGVGYMNGAYDQNNYYIQRCCDGTAAPYTQYYNDIAQMQKVLRARVTQFIYVVAYKSNYTITSFGDSVHSDISNGYSMILSINGKYLPYYQPDQTATCSTSSSWTAIPSTMMAVRTGRSTTRTTVAASLSSSRSSAITMSTPARCGTP